jgi:hypothetical protein
LDSFLPVASPAIGLPTFMSRLMVALVDQNRSSFCCCVGCGVLNPESSFY